MLHFSGKCPGLSALCLYAIDWYGLLGGREHLYPAKQKKRTLAVRYRQIRFSFPVLWSPLAINFTALGVQLIATTLIWL